MVLIQLFLPVSRFLFHEGGEELAMKSQAFLEGLEADMSAAERKAYETDALLEQMTLEEIRRRVEEAQAAQNAEEGTDPGEDETGSNTTDRTVRIDRIQVGEIQLQTDSPESASAEQDP